MKPFPRRACMITAALALAISPAASLAAWAAPEPFMGEAGVLGNPKAPITVIEYASASCPHCARFNNEVFPQFKAKYIDTGKVRYELHELLTPPQDFAAAGFITARCAGKDNYLNAVDAIFHDQEKMYQSGDLMGGLQAVGARFGLSKADLDACLKDPKALDALKARLAAAEKAGVQSTPTFFINGKKIEGETSLGDLMMVIEPMLAQINAGGHG